MLYTEQVNYIDRILDITNSILIIYNELINAKKENTSEKYFEYLEYLKLGVEVENKIYEKLNLKKEEEIEVFLNIFYFRIQHKNYNENVIRKLTKRIENYFIYQTYINPTPSEKKVTQEKIDDNVNKILNQANKDYTISLLNQLEKRIQTEKNKSIYNKLIYSKYDIIFSNKYIEEKLINKKDLKEKTGKEILIKHHQDINLINQIYDSFIFDTLNANLNILLNITNSSLTETKNKYNQILHLLIQKSCLKMASTSSIEAFSKRLYNEFLNTVIGQKYQIISSNSIDKIKEIFNEVYQEEYIQNKNYSKQKKKK